MSFSTSDWEDRRTSVRLFGQLLFFGDGHLRGFAGDEGNAAGGAFAVAATGVQLIGGCVFDQCEDETFARLHFECGLFNVNLGMEFNSCT